MLINCATASILIQAMSAVALWFWFEIIINIHSWTRCWNIQSNQICIPKGNFYYIRKYDFSFRISSQMFLIIPNVISKYLSGTKCFFLLVSMFFALLNTYSASLSMNFAYSKILSAWYEKPRLSLLIIQLLVKQMPQIITSTII